MRRIPRKQRKNSEQYVEKALEDKFTLWALRVLINLNGINTFINRYGEFQRDEIAYFLGLGEYVDANEELNRKEIYQLLKEKHHTIEKENVSLLQRC